MNDNHKQKQMSAIIHRGFASFARQTGIMNSIQNDKQIKRYRKKNKFMKMRIKSLILENAALCDEVAKVQESILIVKDERRFLLHKLMEYENDSEQFYYRSDVVITSNGSRNKIKKRQSCDDTR